MNWLKGAAWLLLLVSIAWLAYAPAFDSLVTCLAGLCGLLTVYIKEARVRRNSIQSQSISGGSSGIQVGGDLHIRRGDMRDE
jgi:hypothetical protein